MVEFANRSLATPRHRTAYLEAGPADGPLMIFVHGWPELGRLWRRQLDHFAGLGWRCIAPDMRGYGGSSVPEGREAYTVEAIVGDMIELHDALGGAPAVWVGHDWGSPIVWGLAAHHAARCRGAVNLCVPYFARGFSFAQIAPAIDRTLYPVETDPAGQWDYFLWYAENAAQAAADFEADIPATVALLYRSGHSGLLGQPALTAGVRARGGWFGPARRAPQLPRDPAILDEADYAALVEALTRNGFTGPDSWYLNGDANTAYALAAPGNGRLAMPVLFLHAAWDTVCDTVGTALAEPMRADCADLTEAQFDTGHWLAQERGPEVNAAIAGWLESRGMRPAQP